MSTPESSLPERWVQRIFTTMRANYGASFDRQWECPAGTDPADHARGMLEHWGRELRGYQQNPSAITYALENLPDHPPTLPEFRALLRRRPETQAPRLSAPRPDPVRLAESMAKVGRPELQENPKQWAHDLEAREKRGEKLTLTQQIAWREALASGDAASDAALFGAGKPIPDDAWPPAMRKVMVPSSQSFDEQDEALANAEAQALQWEAQP